MKITGYELDADNNTVSNLEVDNLKTGVLETTITDDDTKIPSSGAVVDYVSSNSINNVVEDTTPQLGGDLDLNDKAITEELTVGENVANGDLLYLKTSDGKYWKADADAAATASTKLVLATESISADETGTCLIYGQYATTGLTAGIQYVSTTAGDFTSTAPSATGDIVRIIGTAESTTILFFNPSQDFIELA